jgi:hypothetical protein
MQAWLESVAGPEYASALMWTLLALVALLVLLVAVKIVRGLTFGTFVAGGRNRKTRLAVMDAAAVDSQRRLVLVRRDDVEHLILIGGPSDVVVEQNIRLLPPSRRPAEEAQAVAAAPVPERPAQPEPAARPVRTPQPPVATPPRQPAPPPIVPAPPVQAAPPPPPPVSPSVASPAVQASERATEPRFSSLAPTVPVQAPASPPPLVAQPEPVAASVKTLRPVTEPVAETPAPRNHDLDDALLEELEVSLEMDQQRKNAAGPDLSLDEEMSRLLGDLSSKR